MTSAASASRADRVARAVVVGFVAAIAALACLWLYPMNMLPAGGFLVDGPPMRPMPWHASKWIFLFVMWSVMMAGMMIPTAAGMIVAVERRARETREASPWLVTVSFVLAYVTVWTAFSALATLMQWLAERASLMSPMMASASAWMSGAVLVGAGMFQFTPQKDGCLVRCRSPLGFLLSERRRGIGGAFVTGLRHGLFCLGCCWALMALFFVFGTMNLAAAAALAALVLAEKALPGGVVIARVAGAALVVAGVAVLARVVA
jgi:predicted metal-binding membrane protein